MGGLAELVALEGKREFLKGLVSSVIFGMSNKSFSESASKDYLLFNFNSEESSDLATSSIVDRAITDLRAQIPKVVDLIGRSYLHVDQGTVVDLILIDNGIAFAGFNHGRPFMKVPIPRVQNKTVPYGHESAHILAFTRYPGLGSLFAEGMAVYVQDMVGDNPAFPNFYGSVDEIAMREASICYGSKAMPSIAKIVELLNRDVIENPSERRMAYCVAGSFVKHLYEVEFAGRKELFMEAYYDAKNPFTFKKITGVDLDKVETNWGNLLAK